MKYRSEEDIIATILEIAKGGATKTDIMYGGRLTFFQMANYLALLQDNNMLSYNESKRLYKTTEKGLKAIHIQAQFKELMKGSHAQ